MFMGSMASPLYWYLLAWHQIVLEAEESLFYGQRPCTRGSTEVAEMSSGDARSLCGEFERLWRHLKASRVQGKTESSLL